jgi:glycerophosphoryl diester phosphodiesterase
MDTLKEFAAQNKIFVSAHRGASGVAPENTMISFEEAVKAGASMIEVDVQITSDKKIICFHDFNLGRTVKGRKRVNQLPLRAFKKMDAGSWHDPFFHRETVPTLAEAIDFMRDKCYLSVEIKSHKKDFSKDKARRIYEVVKEMDFLENTLFGSFDHKILKIMKENDPEVNTAAIKHPGRKDNPKEVKEIYNPDAFVCSLDEINQEINDECKEAGMMLGIYTVDNWYDMNRIKNFNIKSIASNFPGAVVPILHRYFPV